MRRCEGFVQPVLDAYMEDRRVLEDINLKGLTIKRIMEVWECDFWCALDKLGRYYYGEDKMIRMTIEHGSSFNNMSTWGANGYAPGADPGGHAPIEIWR